MKRIILFSLLAAAGADPLPATGADYSSRDTPASKPAALPNVVLFVHPDSAMLLGPAPVKIGYDSLYTIQNESLIMATLTRDLSREAIDSVYTPIATAKQRIEEDQPGTGNMDTTVTYRIGSDSMAYLAAWTRSFPIYASWTSLRIRLHYGRLHPGMSKQAFIAGFKLKGNVPDVIRITDDDDTRSLILIFGRDTLRRITFD